MTGTHRFDFVRTGGIDQVVLGTGDDLAHLSQLDPKLWAALAMPTRGVNLDSRTLDLLDADKDGRIRVPEVLAAVKLVVDALADPDEVLKASDALALSSIKDPALVAAARRILAYVGKPAADAISLADIDDVSKLLNTTTPNGDGIVPADLTENGALKKAIEDIGATLGTLNDRSGKPGIDLAKCEAFFKEARAFCDWRAQGKSPEVLPAGEATGAASAATAAVEAKVDDYFARCHLASFHPGGATALHAAELDPAKLAGRTLGPASEELARLPLAKAEPGQALALDGGVNPAWRTSFAAFVRDAVPGLLGERTSLSESDWLALKAKLAPFRAWQANKPTTAVEKLGAERLEALLASNTEKALAELIAHDAAVGPELAQAESVEKLLRFRRDLAVLLRNFVNFSDFYQRKSAIFQAGTLYLDGRACDLCVEVTDAGKHASLAAMAATFLAYCDLTRPGGEKTSIVAAFTDGDSDNLFVGRNGVFYDSKGRDWDATITRVVVHPISIRQAFWSPYKKLIRFVEDQIAKRAMAAEADATAKLCSGAGALVQSGAAPAPKKIDVGTVAAISVAFGGIGAMVAGILGAFLGLGVWMPLGLLAVVLLISGPSMVLAWLKLRQRNLGPILDANGWAINGRARINLPFGAALTHLAELPPNARRNLDDPYAERRPWKLYAAVTALLVAAVAWYMGKVDNLLPHQVKSTTVLGAHAPVARPAGPAVAEGAK